MLINFVEYGPHNVSRLMIKVHFISDWGLSLLHSIHMTPFPMAVGSLYPDDKGVEYICTFHTPREWSLIVTAIFL